nr:hypothetical protein [Ruminiclostridium sp.]
MTKTRIKGKAIVSLFLCLAMMIGFIPGFTVPAEAGSLLTLTEFHLTNNFIYSDTTNNSCPKGSVKWTTTGISETITGAKIFFSDMGEADFFNNELTDPDPYQFSRAWCLTIYENDCGTVTSTGGEASGDFLWLPTATEPSLGGYVKGAAQVVLYSGTWNEVYASPWFDVHQDWEVVDPYMNTDSELKFDYQWSALDQLADLGEDNNKYEAEIYVWQGWTASDPYAVNDCWIATVPFVAEEDIQNDTMQFVTLTGGFYYNELYPAFSGTAPTLAAGDKVTLGVEVYSDYGSTLVKRMPPIRFEIAGGSSSKAKQPSVSPAEASWSTSDTSGITVTKNDGSFTFDSITNGTATLTGGTDYTVSGSSVTIEKAYLATLAAGEHTFTFHYTGEVNGTTPTDPTLTVTITEMCTPTLTVTGYEGADITVSCTVTWKNSRGITLTAPVSVASGTVLTYTVTPGDTLKIGGVQYYGTATAEVTVTGAAHTFTAALPQNGTVTVTPKAGGTAIPEGYRVEWYTRDKAAKLAGGGGADTGGDYSYIGTGATSPLMPAGTTLYCDITMSGSNRDNYPDLEKQPVTVEFGNKAQDVSLTAKNNITLTVTGEGITADAYDVSWYEKNTDGTFRRVNTGTQLKDLGASVGKVYYYEITPRDYYDYGARKTVYNWLRFKGVPLSETATKVTVTEEAQNIPVTLAAVKKVTLTGTVTNGAAVGMNNLTFTVTQNPYDGYLSAGNYYSYGSKWNDIQFTLNGGIFTAQVYDFQATLKVSEKTGNFRTYYKTIAAADLGTPLSFALSSEELPGEIPLTITKQYPDGRAENLCGYSTLSRGGWNSDEGIFNDMKFTLVNKTKGNAVIDPGLYNVSPSEVQFTDMDAIAGVIEMGDELTLSYTVDKIDGEVDKTSSTVKVLRNYYEAGYDWNSRQFSLSYKDMPNVYFTSPDGYGTKHTIALYSEDGGLADTVEDTYYGWTHSVPAGTYTIVNFRRTDWLSAPATLEGLQAILSPGEYLSETITLENGLCTVVEFGASPQVKDHKVFTENSKFADETVKANVDEWALVKVGFEVDPSLARANPGAQYVITIQTANGERGTGVVLTRYDTATHTVGVASKDKYISLYSGGKLVESTVKIGARDSWHMQAINYFKLYTTETSGEIWFYIQAPKGGDFPITAAGARVDANDREVNSHSFGKMTLTVTSAGSSLNINSDYLRTSDNGSGTGYKNGIWLYTTAESEVKLYMDGVQIDRYHASDTGIAYFDPIITETKVGDANVSTFRANDPGWTVAGMHELYAITTKGDTEIRSATTNIEVLTKDS